MKKFTILSSFFLVTLFSLTSCANYGKKLSKKETEDYFKAHFDNPEYGDSFKNLKRFNTLSDYIHFEGKTFYDGKEEYTCSGDIDFKNLYFKADLSEPGMDSRVKKVFYIVKEEDKFKRIEHNITYDNNLIRDIEIDSNYTDLKDKFIEAVVYDFSGYGMFINRYMSFFSNAFIIINPYSKTAKGNLYKDNETYNIVGEDNYKEMKTKVEASIYKDCLMKYNYQNEYSKDNKKKNYRYECSYSLIDSVTIDDTSSFKETIH